MDNEVATKAALGLLRSQIEEEKTELISKLSALSADSQGKKQELDIGKRAGRELYYKLMFTLLAGTMIDRLGELNTLKIRDVLDRLIKLAGAIREESSPPGGGQKNLIILQGQQDLKVLDAQYHLSEDNEE